MIKRSSMFFKKHKFVFYSLLLSFCVLLFTSKNSFLYRLNDWVDANAFFTVGKSMFNGVVPYKELFEQKGILLYFIYGCGYLLSHNNFYGVFIIEVIFMTVFLYYSYKTLKLFVDEKFAYFVLPIIILVITTSNSFVHGGACEEFCFPFFAVSIYYFFKHYKEKKLSYKEIFLNGLMAGAILMIKYTMLGFWFAWMMFLFFDILVNKKDIKKAFISCIVFLLGMFIPFGISLIYFIVNDGVKEFIECYFTINMTLYGDMSISFLSRVLNIFRELFKTLIHANLIISSCIFLLPVLIFKLDITKYAKFSFIGVFLFTILGIYYGQVFYSYYVLPIYLFILISLIGLCVILEKYGDKLFSLKYDYLVYSFVFVIFVVLSYWQANYKEMILDDKENYFQFKYADYMSKFDNPTLLNMGYLDAGLYTTTGIVPNTRFFEVQNIDYDKFPDNLDEMKKYVENREVMFILYYTKKDLESVKSKDPYIFLKYHLVYDDSYYFEKEEYKAYLFQVNE